MYLLKKNMGFYKQNFCWLLWVSVIIIDHSRDSISWKSIEKCNSNSFRSIEYRVIRKKKLFKLSFSMKSNFYFIGLIRIAFENALKLHRFISAAKIRGLFSILLSRGFWNGTRWSFKYSIMISSVQSYPPHYIPCLFFYTGILFIKSQIQKSFFYIKSIIARFTFFFYNLLITLFLYNIIQVGH